LNVSALALRTYLFGRGRYSLTKGCGAPEASVILRLPLLPRAVRIVDGLAIGLGALWLAWAIWRKARCMNIRRPRGTPSG